MALHMFHMGRTVFRMSKKPANTTHFGEAVAARIVAKGLSLRNVADQTGIPLTTLHRRIRSASMSFTLGELTRIAALLDTTAGTIVLEFEGGEAA